MQPVKLLFMCNLHSETGIHLSMAMLPLCLALEWVS